MFKGSLLSITLTSSLALFLPTSVHANFGSAICNQPEYKCVQIKQGDHWKKLFPDNNQRDLVMRLNRLNTALRPGQIIAVPDKLSSLELKDISPFPSRIDPLTHGTIFVDQKNLAWGAYNTDGFLLKWGPMSGGKQWCQDTQEKCHTPSGEFFVFRKGNVNCKSSIFPLNIPGGGAPMPYCAFFKGGIAFHGSNTVPGYNASHGCVRIFTEDAHWLNTQFIKMNHTRVLIDTSLPNMKW